MSIKAVNVFCPKKLMTNEDLIRENGLDSSHQWIIERTGIHSRYISETSAADMAVAAAQGLALQETGLIKLLIVATSTHRKSFPSIAVHVHKALSLAQDCVCFDLNDACNGFVQAVAVAQQLIKGTGNEALVIGVDQMSDIVDWSDRGTSILFGDGAGAMVIGNDELFKSTSYTISEHADELYADPKVHMNGPKVFKYAVTSITKDIETILAINGLSVDQIRYFVPHQANSRIIEAVRERLNVTEDRIVNMIEHYGNTSAATIPIGIHSIYHTLQTGDLLVLSGFAAGFRGGSVIVQK